MKTVLIADDSEFMRRMIKKILTENNYEVVGEAENGHAAVTKYSELKPDIVTLDITMPVLDGLAALKKILELDAKAKVVMMSAMGQEPIVEEAIRFGAKGFIFKPFKEDAVVGLLVKL